ncbi:PqqD family protein [Haloarcula salina]|uniref:PqqD family protein n=1 Tax=Haloarcula salina TaxID=1429914 RepID=A0AA41KGK1_9EURY|nr:PqqD family protein [Haloarcula salina]MBV0900761.1 PqqD family protein [Haloarcula salina]
MVTIETGTTVVATDDCVATAVDDEVIVLNSETGMYQGLTGVGPDIWRLVQEPTEFDEIVSALVAEYDVDRARCASDVSDFLETLATSRLVETDANAAR